MENYRTELKKQMRFILGSASLYDAGNRDESIRIATALELIFNDEGRYKTLPIWDELQNAKMISTCTAGFETKESWISNLIKMELAPSAGIMRFLPSLSLENTHTLNVKDWWDSEVIFRFREFRITRKKIVLWARNTDGGSHIQPKHSAYKWLFSGGWSMQLNPDGQEPRKVTAQFGHLAALRQIAFEISNSNSFKSLWHPNWKSTHMISCTPSDSSHAPTSWDVMHFDGYAYTQQEWEDYSDPRWAIDADGKFQLIGESPCIGLIEIQRKT